MTDKAKSVKELRLELADVAGHVNILALGVDQALQVLDRQPTHLLKETIGDWQTLLLELRTAYALMDDAITVLRRAAIIERRLTNGD